jgi:hypothetical protein
MVEIARKGLWSPARFGASSRLSPHIAHSDPGFPDLVLVPLAELSLPQRPALAVHVTNDHGGARSTTRLPATSRR